MADPNLSEVVVFDLRNRRKELRDNVTKHNALLRRLKSKNKIQEYDGGRTIVEELEYAENQTFQWYTGYDILNINPSVVFSAAEFDHKQAATVVTLSGLEKMMNSGKERILPLLSKRVDNAMKTMANNLSIGIYSDGTGSAGKQIGGLQLLVPDDPTTGTAGGINRANFTFWRSQKYSGATDGGAAVSTANIQAYMNALWQLTIRGTDKVDIIPASNAYYNFYWQGLQAIQRISDGNTADAGYVGGVKFMGADVIFDDSGGCPVSHMYFLNTDYIYLRVHQDRNMDVLDARNSINQDAEMIPVGWMGNMTASNLARQGVLIA